MATYQPLEEDDWEEVPHLPSHPPSLLSPVGAGFNPPIRVISDDIENMVIVDHDLEPHPDKGIKQDPSLSRVTDPHEQREDTIPLIQDEEDDEYEEDGLKGVADVDYLPENENEIAMIRG